MRIILTGFMGSGKTYIGRELAKKLGYKFIDLDEYIIQKEKRSIPDIFKEYGEKYFREIEIKYLKETLEGIDNIVLSLGGGTLQNKNVIDYIKKNGILIFLDADVRSIYHRVKGDQNRPLLAGLTEEQKIEKIKTLLEKRLPLYKQAHYTVRSNLEDSIPEVVENIIRIIKDENIKG